MLLRPVTVHHVPKCMSCHKAIVVITRRAHCFHDNIYSMLILLLWDLNNLYAGDYLWPLIKRQMTTWKRQMSKICFKNIQSIHKYIIYIYIYVYIYIYICVYIIMLALSFFEIWALCVFRVSSTHLNVLRGEVNPQFFKMLLKKESNTVSNQIF